jgi:dephospho-CoA kinase
MIKVGLTGNIGSGKSTVTRIFETLGVPVYHADEEAKKFLTKKKIQLAINEKFGDTVFSGSTLDRKKLASIVFSDQNALAFLNSLIHPLVREHLKVWFDHHIQNSYVIQEAAILFESGFYREFDKIITVAAPVELAIQRVMHRDGIGKEEIEKRMHHQWEQERKIEHSNFIIYNDEDHLVIPQVLAIHNELSKIKKGR